MSEEIRNIREAERGEYSTMRRYAFRDWTAEPPSEQELAGVAPEDSLGLFLDGKLAAGVMAHRFLQSVRGVIKRMGGVAAVASYPENRGRGYAARLLERSYLMMRDRGEPVSMLHPFRESFYERLGYVAAGAWLEVELPTEALAHTLARRPEAGWVEERLAPAEARAPYAALLPEIAARYNGFAFPADPSSPFWQGRVRDNLFVLIRKDGVLKAAARYEKLTQPGRLKVRAPWWADLAGRNALLRYLATHRDAVPTISLQLPYGTPIHTWLRDAMSPFTVSWDAKPWMVRILDVPGALDGIPALPDGRLVVELSDDRCPWSNGRFAIEAAGGRLRASATREAPEVALDQKALASLLYGARSVEEVRDLGWMGGPAPLLEQWFPRAAFFNSMAF
jgi:predicted acetyltransferase